MLTAVNLSPPWPALDATDAVHLLRQHRPAWTLAEIRRDPESAYRAAADLIETEYSAVADFSPRDLARAERQIRAERNRRATRARNRDRDRRAQK